MLLDALLRRPPSAGALPLPLYMGAKLPPLARPRPPARPTDVPPYSFSEGFAQFSFATYLTRPEAVSCGVKARARRCGRDPLCSAATPGGAGGASKPRCLPPPSARGGSG